MRIRRVIARLYWRISRWSPGPAPAPVEGSGILIGAPHTSNWDFVLMLALSWHLGISVRYLGKASLFRPPFGRVMRLLGGVPVDRDDPSRLVEEIVTEVRGGDRRFLVITPEGTRTLTSHWKSGFHRIARETGLPVTLGYVDRRNMTAGLGPTMTLSGDVHADMERIREFYADKLGVRPAAGAVPRLRSEDSAALGSIAGEDATSPPRTDGAEPSHPAGPAAAPGDRPVSQTPDDATGGDVAPR